MAHQTPANAPRVASKPPARADRPALPGSPPGLTGRQQPGGSGALLPFLVALVPFLWLVARFQFLTDDAYISFRYAKHLAQGRGLIFNIGETVEGYSNFLWVLLLAAGERLGLPAPVLAPALSIACGVALLLLTTRAIAARAGRLATFCGALFVATLPPLAVWSTGGLATLPAALAVFGLFTSLWSARTAGPSLPAALGWALAAILLRADGFVWVGLLGALFALETARAPAAERARCWRVFAWLAGVSALVLALHFGFRQAYYGDWLPNTARAKVSGDALPEAARAWFTRRGWHYVVSLFLAFPSLLVALALGLGALVPRTGSRLPRGLAVGLLFVGANLAYVVRVGGDFMAMGRFFVPSLAFCGLAFALGIERLVSAPRSPAVGRAAALLLTAAACTLSLLPAFDRHVVSEDLRWKFHFRWNDTLRESFKSEYAMWRFMKQNALTWVELGRALSLHTAPDERMLAAAIGAVGYYSDLYLYDSYGLVSREIAARPIRVGSEPPYLKSPGHADRGLDGAFFAQRRLDYMGAEVRPAADPFAHRPASWRANNNPNFRVELRPLDPALGFEPGRVLMLLRTRR